jgi:hypothetical protein
MYTVANVSLSELQGSQPLLYESITKNLSPEEQQVIQGAVHQADVIAHAAQAEAAALAQTEQPNGHSVVTGASQPSG